MQSVILAAGKGTRMGDLTKSTPKPMLKILDKPLLEYHLDSMPEEIDEVIIVIGYLGEQIREYFGDEWKGRKIRYANQRDDMHGTAGALHSAKDMLHDRFLVTMGDDLYRKDDLKNLLQHPLAILGLFTEDASSFGLITENEHHNLVSVVERPHGYTEGFINVGAYSLDIRFFQYNPIQITETEFGLPQTLAVMSTDYPVKVIKATAWQPVGNPNNLPEAEKFLY